MSRLARASYLIPCLLVAATACAEDDNWIAKFSSMDRDHSGLLDLNEYLIASGAGDMEKAAKLGQAFARMDTDNSGMVSLGEYVTYQHRLMGTAAPAVKTVPVAVVTPASKPTPTPHASVVAAPKPVPAAKSAPATASDEDEKDEVDQNLAKKLELYPWTDNQKRSIEHTLLPGAATVQEHHFHYRIVHVAREVWYEDTTTNLMGLDDSVKIGLQLGYGITDKLDVNLTRSNGRTLQLAGRPVNMDYWDLLFKYRLMQQDDDGIADVSLVAGGTTMLRNRGKADLSLDAELVIERSLLWDRLRLGTGIAHAGLSSYESINGLGPGTKLLPDEYDYKGTSDVPSKSTTSVPLNVIVAVSERWQVFAEYIYPIAGYRTDGGPSGVLGARFNTHTHEYSFYFANTANTAFNTAITGGADGWSNLPVFGFSIVAHL
jgi:hypothetical protein